MRSEEELNESDRPTGGRCCRKSSKEFEMMTLISMATALRLTVSTCNNELNSVMYVRCDGNCEMVRS